MIVRAEKAYMIDTPEDAADHGVPEHWLPVGTALCRTGGGEKVTLFTRDLSRHARVTGLPSKLTSFKMNLYEFSMEGWPTEW